MYIGKRDAFVPVIVSVKDCSPYQGADNREWIEVTIPRTNAANGTGTIMVKPEQVHYVRPEVGRPVEYNVIYINEDAKIINSTKLPFTREVCGQDVMTPSEIIGAIIRKECAGICPQDMQPIDVFNWYKSTEMDYMSFLATMKASVPGKGAYPCG